ncbi:MAG: FAD-dependent oxidoreductase, partial [Pseudomonadota bacterium]
MAVDRQNGLPASLQASRSVGVEKTEDAQGSAVLVVGAGVFGLWQALLLAKAGCRVRVIERSKTPFA